MTYVSNFNHTEQENRKLNFDSITIETEDDRLNRLRDPSPSFVN